MDQVISLREHDAMDTSPEQYSLGQAILLHLLPGAIAAVVYILSVPFFTRLGYPSITALGTSYRAFRAWDVGRLYSTLYYFRSITFGRPGNSFHASF